GIRLPPILSLTSPESEGSGWSWVSGSRAAPAPRNDKCFGFFHTLSSAVLAEGAAGFLSRTLGGEVIHRRLHPASAVRHSGQLQRHLDGTEGAENHRLVQIAEMADAEHAAAQPVEPAAERDIEFVEGELAHLLGIPALRHLNRGDRTGLRPRVDRENLRP